MPQVSTTPRKLKYFPLDAFSGAHDSDVHNPLQQQVDELVTFLGHLRDHKGLTTTGKRLLKEYGFDTLLNSHTTESMSGVLQKDDKPTLEPDLLDPLGGKTLRDVVLGENLCDAEASLELSTPRSTQRKPRPKTKAPKVSKATLRLANTQTESSRQKLVASKTRIASITRHSEIDGSPRASVRSSGGSQRPARLSAPARPSAKKGGQRSSKGNAAEPAPSWNFMTPDDDAVSTAAMDRGNTNTNTNGDSDDRSDFSFVNLARLDRDEFLEYSSGTNALDTTANRTAFRTDGIHSESFRSRASSFV